MINYILFKWSEKESNLQRNIPIDLQSTAFTNQPSPLILFILLNGSLF